MKTISAKQKVALFLDFDGTLVEIAPTPEGIAVPADCARRLDALAQRLAGRVALVSGRSIDNLHHHLGPVGLARAGSHGVEQVLGNGVRIADPAAFPAEVGDALRGFAAAHEGMEFEEKAYGGALHFRARPALEPQALAFAEALAERRGLALKRGSCVVELVRRGASKAGAVHGFMQVEPFAGAVPVFIGDDITDEDGFRAANELGGFGIIIGARADTLARYRLASPSTLYEWLGL